MITFELDKLSMYFLYILNSFNRVKRKLKQHQKKRKFLF